MARLFSRWADAARAVSGALLEVLAAEAQELQSDLARSGRELRGGLVLVGVAAGVAFWTLGLGVWALVEVARLWLPAYGAAGVVFGLGVVLTVLFVWLGRRRFRRIEPPVETVRRRTEAHAEWWRQSVLPELGVDLPDPDAESGSEGDSGEEA